MKSSNYPAVLAFMVALAALAATAQETLHFIPTAAPDGMINYSWFSGDNWYRLDPNTQTYVKAGTLPVPLDTAEVTGTADAAANTIQLAHLVPFGGSVINGGNFIVGELAPAAAGSTFHGSTLEITSDMFGGGVTLDDASLLIDPGAYALVGGPLLLSGTGGGTNIYGWGTTVYNEGSFVLAGGSLATAGNTAFMANFSNRPNAVLSSSGTSSVSGAAPELLHLDNAGLIRCDGGTLKLGPGIVWTSSNTNGLSRFKTTASDAIINLDLTVPAGLTFAISGPGLSQLTGASATVDGLVQVGVLDAASQLIDVGTLEVKTDLAGAGSVHVLASAGYPSTLVWDSGMISLPTVGIDAGGLLIISNIAFFPAPSLSNMVVNVSGSTTLAGALSGKDGAVFNNLASGFFDLQTSGTVDYLGAGTRPVFNNAGTFQNAANVQPTFKWAFTNRGSVLLKSNKTTFAAGFTQTAGTTVVAAGAQLASFEVNGVPSVFIQGGTLSGAGTIDGFVTNSATVHPGSSPGILTVMGGYPTPYSQGPTGTLAIDIGGLAAGTQYSRLAVVGGAAALDGTLSVIFINGFLPAPGDSFTVVTFPSGSGHFSTLNGIHAANGVVLVPHYTAAGVTLVAAAEVAISGPTLTGNHFNFSFNTTTGSSYVVEFAGSLTPPVNWQSLTNLAGNGSPAAVVDPSTAAGTRFYRVRFQ